MDRHSRPVLAALLAALAVIIPTVPASAAEIHALSTGPDVSYPLRHDFSMAPGIAGHGKKEPTSCFNVVGSQGDYLCRIVAGVEETGDKRNFLVRKEDGLDDRDDDTGRYGHQLVSRDGVSFEGCKQWRTGDWFCDYASRQPVSRTHYDSSGYVFNVFWAWQKHTRGQIGCALAMNGFWATGGWRAFVPMLDACLNGPMERPE